MARVGVNPARDRRTPYRPANITLAVLVHIPALAGYHQYRLDILKLCLGSLIHNTPGPYDLLVFDNRSCEAVRDYLISLRERGLIQYLILAGENIGKIGAFRVMFRAAPGELVAYSDDDVFFYPGWLQAHLRILERFPRVGVVSGTPLRGRFDQPIRSNMAFAEENEDAWIDKGKFIPDEWEIDFAATTGRDPEHWLEESRGREEIRLHYRNEVVYATANHFQFLALREAIVRALPEEWSGRLMREMRQLDEAVDELGYLRLTTLERSVRHMGNVPGPELIEEAASLGVRLPEEVDLEPARGWRHWIVRIPGARRVLQGLYNQLFWILNRTTVRPRKADE
jgi:glycosyltransferase involved in cell wall biosynthesis